MAWVPLLDPNAPAPPTAGPDLTPQAAPPVPADNTTWLGRRLQGVGDMVSGAKTTEYPDAQEFRAAYEAMPMSPEEQGSFVKATWLPHAAEAGSRGAGITALNRADITPNPQAQVDILKKAIPGLEQATDAHGNIMLRAPGMTGYAYLNKPGLSLKDASEGVLQTAATAPLLGPAGRAASVTGQIVKGALGAGAASVGQDLAATAAGSEQGVDTDRALLSAGLGAAVPLTTAAARGAVGYVGNKIGQARNLTQNIVDPAGAAQRELQGAFQADFDSGALNNADRVAQPSDRAVAAGMNQDLRAMDFGGGNVEREARKAANFSPSAKDSLMRVIGDRFEGQTQRADELVTGGTGASIAQGFGLSRSSDAARQDLMNQARNARAPLYNQAFAAGQVGIDTPVIDQLQKSGTFQKAMGRAEYTLQDQNSLPGWRPWTAQSSPNGGAYTLAYWDQVKRNLDDYAGQAIRQGKKNQAAIITEMARQLRGELDQAVPLYRQARGTAEGFFNAENALDAGQKFATGSFNWDDAAAHINSLNPAEKNLFAEGFADEFVKKIRSVPDRSSLLSRIMQSPMEQRRVELALGKPRADQLETFLRIEGIMDKWRGVMGNSTTAQQASDMMKGYGAPLPSNLGNVAMLFHSISHPVAGLVHAGAMLHGAIMAGGKAAQLRINENVANEVARLLTSKDPDLFLRGLQQTKGPVAQALKAFDDMINGIQPFVAQRTMNADSYQPAGQ